MAMRCGGLNTILPDEVYNRRSITRCRLFRDPLLVSSDYTADVVATSALRLFEAILKNDLLMEEEDEDRFDLGQGFGTDLASAAYMSRLTEKGIQKLDLKPGSVNSILQVSDLKNSHGPANRVLQTSFFLYNDCAAVGSGDLGFIRAAIGSWEGGTDGWFQNLKSYGALSTPLLLLSDVRRENLFIS
ncbi:hypothetical protein LguiB_006764 [Lonicera macranthoides]